MSTSPEDVRRDFERVVESLGRVPDAPEYNEHGAYSAMDLARHFADSLPISYDDAVHNLGYTISDESRGRIPEKEVKRDFTRVVLKLGHIPSYTEYNEHGAHAPQTLIRKFADGSSQYSSQYDDAVYALGYRPDD